MTKRFIMTAFAQDRVGLVADITKIIFDNDCNLEDTQMALLEDEFCTMLLFTGQKGDLEEQINKDCRRLEWEEGITAFIRELPPEPAPHSDANTLHTIQAEGVDQAGIVYKISQRLSRDSINIKRLRSHPAPEPSSGTMIYSVRIEIEVPNGTSLEKVEQNLSELGNEMHIDFTLDEDIP